MTIWARASGVRAPQQASAWICVSCIVCCRSRLCILQYRAPYSDDVGLSAEIANLRAMGEVVVVNLPGSEEYSGELQYDRDLVLRDGVWQVVAI